MWILSDKLPSRVGDEGRRDGRAGQLKIEPKHMQGGLGRELRVHDSSLLLAHSCSNGEGGTDFVWKCSLKSSSNGSKDGVRSDYQI